MTFSRRGFLRGAGAALALPLIQALAPRSAWAAEETFPKRLVIFFTPGGVTPAKRLLSQGEYDFVLGETLQPLAPYRDKLLFVDGLRLGPRHMGPGDPHVKGMAQLLTGMPVSEGLLFGQAGGDGFYAWAGGISVDQAVANALAGSTPLGSLQLGISSGATPLTTENVLSYRGENQPLPSDDSPSRVYSRLFGISPAVRTARLRSLDVVRADLAQMERRLGARDREVLQAHGAAVDEMESFLQALEGGETCSAPASLANAASADLVASAESQIQLLVHALRCDLTRVGLLQISHGIAEDVYAHLGVQGGHHAITHDAEHSAQAKASLVKIETWFAEQFARLLATMAAVPEGDGTLLDHSIVLWCNELDEPWHASEATQSNLPFVLAGGGRGTLDTGRFVTFPGRAHNDLLLTLIHAMGIQADSFGHPDFSTGPLTELFATT